MEGVFFATDALISQISQIRGINYPDFPTITAQFRNAESGI